MLRYHLGFPLLACFLSAVATLPVEAQDADVVGKLTEFGGLKKREARSLVKEVSKKMQTAADSLAGMNDPVRMAMRIAVFGAVSGGPQQDMVNDAKARLYLYAGLDDRALALLFRPGPTSVSACMGSFRLSQGECEALVAAAAQRSVAEIKMQQSARQPAPMNYGAMQPVTPARTYAPAPTPTYAPAPTPTYAPAPTPTYAPAPAPVARPAPGPNASTAAAYKARREAYLAKFKKKSEPQSPPAAPAAAAPAAAAPAAAAPAAAPAPVAEPAVAAAAPPSAAPPAPEAAKPAVAAKEKKKAPEPDPLIDDLLSDPMGKSK